MESIKALIVDDEDFYANCIKIILEANSVVPCRVVGIAENGKVALQYVAAHRPDVVLMDIRMPELDGVETTRIIHERYPKVRILILTTFDDEDYVVDALRHGASGYVLKTINSDDLVAAVAGAYHGTYQMSPSVAQKLVREAITGLDRDSENTSTYHGRINYMTTFLSNLSRREVQVLDLLLQDFDNYEIADRLGIVEQTVKNYISLIYSKLGVRDRNHAKRHVRQAMEEQRSR